MATSNDTFCDVCYGRHVTKPADHWCPVCEETFCTDCLEPHSRMKLTKGHRVISIDNYKKLPPSLPKLSRHCNEHDKEYHIYCPDHECLCCPVCAITTHKQCSRLIPLDDAIKTSKTSVSLEQLESALSNIEINMEKVQTDREINVANIDKQGQTFHAEIQKRRNLINSHLDQMEEKLHGDVNIEKEKAMSVMQKTLQKISENRDKVHVLQQNLLAVKEYGSDIQTFLFCRTLEAEILNHEKFLMFLEQHGSLQQMKLHLELDKKLSNLSELHVFGVVSTEINPQSVILQTGQEKQAQIMSTAVQSPTKNINDINCTLKSKFNIPKTTFLGFGQFYGSVIFSSDRIIFTDSIMNRLTITNDDGTQIRFIPLTSSPCDVEKINNKTVAVSTEINIQIIDIETEKVTKKYKIYNKEQFYGITHLDGYLYCANPSGLQTIDLSSMKSSVLLHETLSNWDYIAASNNQLFVTNCITNTVTCYSTQGRKIWENAGDAVSNPRCITVDEYSNVYVLSEGTKSVVVFSLDGKHNRKLIDLSNKGDQLWGLHYDKVSCTLLVSTTDGEAYLYNICKN